MMKLKCTNTDLYSGFACIIKVPYCDASDLLSYSRAIAYNAGVYGWNYDVYASGCCDAIVTGYRMRVEGIYPSRKTLKKYNALAKKVILKSEKYSITKRKLDRLISKFVEEVKKENRRPVEEYNLV